MKVDIIGAGVAGLTLGIRLQKAGIETHIFDQHYRTGGLCTSWFRNGFDLGGCLHWILGARNGSSFHSMWQEVVDMSQLQWHSFDVRVDIEVPNADDSTWHFALPNNVDALESYLLKISPEDSSLISLWVNDIRTVARHLPDLPPYCATKNIFGKALYFMGLWRMADMLPLLRRWRHETTHTFASQFRNPQLREAIRRLYLDETGMVTVIFGQAYMTSGVAAYPIGGARAFVQLLEETYTQTGGTLHMGSRVERIKTNGGKAMGLTLSNGTETHADVVASAADWQWTLTQALGNAFTPRTQRELTQWGPEHLFPSYCRVHLGVRGDMSHTPHFLRLNKDYSLPDGTTFEQIEVEVNNFDPTLAPDGCTTISVNYPTRHGDWWINLRQQDKHLYAAHKKKLLDDTVLMLANILTDTKIEASDVVTPATFHRYTVNAFGTSQGWAPQLDPTHRLPTTSTLPGLNNFYLCGQWLEAGGGLPVAMITARRIAQAIVQLRH